MLAESLDDWEEAACREVKCQAFIDASLGPREFRSGGNSKKEQRCDRPSK